MTTARVSPRRASLPRKAASRAPSRAASSTPGPGAATGQETVGQGTPSGCDGKGTSAALAAAGDIMAAAASARAAALPRRSRFVRSAVSSLRSAEARMRRKWVYSSFGAAAVLIGVGGYLARDQIALAEIG